MHFIGSTLYSQKWHTDVEEFGCAPTKNQPLKGFSCLLIAKLWGGGGQMLYYTEPNCVIHDAALYSGILLWLIEGDLKVGGPL